MGKTRRVKCDQCQLLRINGVVCHETGCPNAWKGTTAECKWCGTTFRLKSNHQRFCSKSCERSWRG